MSDAPNPTNDDKTTPAAGLPARPLDTDAKSATSSSAGSSSAPPRTTPPVRTNATLMGLPAVTPGRTNSNTLTMGAVRPPVRASAPPVQGTSNGRASERPSHRPPSVGPTETLGRERKVTRPETPTGRSSTPPVARRESRAASEESASAQANPESLLRAPRAQQGRYAFTELPDEVVSVPPPPSESSAETPSGFPQRVNRSRADTPPARPVRRSARRADGEGDNTPIVPVSIADVLREADEALRATDSQPSPPEAHGAMPSVMVDPSISEHPNSDDGQVVSPSDARPSISGRLPAPWAEADTMLIPKSMLDEPAKTTPFWKLGNSTVLIVCAVLLAGAFLADRLMSDGRDSARDTATATVAAPARTPAAATTTTVAASPTMTTTLLSDPPGAEVVHDGAIIGNTPVAVPREDSEALYLLRQTGFAPQLVKVSAASGPSVRVTLQRSAGIE